MNPLEVADMVALRLDFVAGRKNLRGRILRISNDFTIEEQR